jgi:hypothetical protein
MWDAQRDPLTVRAAAVPCPPGDADAFNLHALGCSATLFKDERGEELLIGRGRKTVRLSLHAGTLIGGPVRLDYRLEGRRHLERRLLALRRWEAMVRLGHVPHSLAAPAANANRNMLVLRTMNALARSGRTRDVAIALFGEAHVARDWGHESDYLRMKTRRLISKARQLAAGGYLALVAGDR